MELRLLPNENNIAVCRIPTSDLSLTSGIKLQMELLSNRGIILDRQYLEIGISDLPKFVYEGVEISVFDFFKQKALQQLGIEQDPSELPPEPPAPLPDPMANYLKKDDASAIRFKYTPTPENSLITAENLQSALDQTIAILTNQQTQISVLKANSRQPIVSDTFTASANTSLDIHTPQTYPSSKWVEQVGDWAITNNQVGSNGTGGSLAWIESSMGSCVIESEVVFSDSSVPQGIVFRYASQTNYWRAVYSKASGKWVINEISGLQTSIRAATGGTVTFGQIYKLKVILDGNNINFYLDDEPILSWTSIVNVGATKHGLYASSSAIKFDSFKVVSLV